MVAVSQSGETADTLAAVRQAHQAGAKVIAITNVVGSALSLEADGALYMQAGPEISVAGTKTFMTQMVCGLMLALRLGDARGTLDVSEHQRLVAELQGLPATCSPGLPRASRWLADVEHTRITQTQRDLGRTPTGS